MSGASRSHKQTSSTKKLLGIAVVGGGISGIETAAEISVWLRDELSNHSLDSSAGVVHLVSSPSRLLSQALSSINRKLHKQLEEKTASKTNSVP